MFSLVMLFSERCAPLPGSGGTVTTMALTQTGSTMMRTAMALLYAAYTIHFLIVQPFDQTCREDTRWMPVAVYRRHGLSTASENSIVLVRSAIKTSH